MSKAYRFPGFLIVVVAIYAAAVAQISTADNGQIIGKVDRQPLVIPSGTLVKLRPVRQISSRTMKRGDAVDLRLHEDLYVGHRVVIPAGTLVQGSVVRVRRPGFIARRSRLRIHLDTLVTRGMALDLTCADLTLKGRTTLGRKALSGVTTVAAGSVSPVVGVLVGSRSLFRRGPEIEIGPQTLFLTRLVKPLELPLQLTRPAKRPKRQQKP